MDRKLKYQLWLAISTFLVLFILMIIQVLFLIRAGKLEEKHFNRSVILALREARSAIVQEARNSNNIHDYVCGNDCSVDVQILGFQKVDSIIQSNLSLNKIDLEYTFDFINDDIHEEKECRSCYAQSLNGMYEQTGIKLQIEFPDYSKFLLAQMGPLFYISILAILFVMISFYFTYRLFASKQTLLENIKSFIDNMVHEFQTPVANIKLASNMLLKKIPETEKKNLEYVKLIQNENVKLSGHVSDILSVVTLYGEDGQMENIHIHDLLSECFINFEPVFKQKNGTMVLQLDAGNSIVKGCSTNLKHAFFNLIDNAFKYVSGKPELIIKTYNRKDSLYIVFHDNGIGIPTSEFKHIFEKYYRISTGNVHNIKGFGLGLNFVKGVVEKIGGSVSVTSNLNEGSIFLIQLKCSCNNKK